MSAEVQARLKSDNILVNGKVDRKPPRERVDQAVYSWVTGTALMTAKRHIGLALIEEGRGVGNCGEMSAAVLRLLVDYLLDRGNEGRARGRGRPG